MAIEANVLADTHEAYDGANDRRARVERRGRDRRKPGSRINSVAPTWSKLRRLGLTATGVMAAILVITVGGSEATGIAVPASVLTFETAALAVAVIVTALGLIEQRLIEIRLELMMMNGGRRAGEDRRVGNRRGE